MSLSMTAIMEASVYMKYSFTKKFDSFFPLQFILLCFIEESCNTNEVYNLKY
jgi:hypothetical protein